jgi:hypothetical protein
VATNGLSSSNEADRDEGDERADNGERPAKPT